MASDPTGQVAAYQVVEAYGPGRFRISGEVFNSSVLVLPERTVAWPVASFEELGEHHFSDMIAAAKGIEILLLGCGARMQLVPPSLPNALRAAGIVLEPMDTGAAARTFNLLLSEDRRVAAALIVLPEDQS